MLDGVVTDGPEEVGVPLGMSDAGTAEIGAVVWPPGGGLQGKGGGTITIASHITCGLR